MFRYVHVAQTITDADYEYLLHILEHTVRCISVNVYSDKTEFIFFFIKMPPSYEMASLGNL